MTNFKNLINRNSGGKFILSTMKHLEEKSNAESPSVKMVLSGKESYKVNGHRYTLDLEHFLIVDSNNHIEINIDAKNGVNGVCIFPSKNLLNDVAKSQISSCESLLDKPFENQEIGLVHNQFKFSENRTGKFLQQNIPTIIQLQKQQEVMDLQDFYIDLSECMVLDQLDLEGKLKHVTSAKRATKEELYRRVIVAKYFIEDSFSKDISLDQLAQEAYLSKYHFTRTFKTLFGLSPYQYLLRLRLEKAEALLSLDYSYNEVSNLIGFSDGKNLRKAIKKMTTA